MKKNLSVLMKESELNRKERKKRIRKEHKENRKEHTKREKKKINPFSDEKTI